VVWQNVKDSWEKYMRGSASYMRFSNIRGQWDLIKKAPSARIKLEEVIRHEPPHLDITKDHFLNDPKSKTAKHIP
jgi:hypothetical protein